MVVGSTATSSCPSDGRTTRRSGRALSCHAPSWGCTWRGHAKWALGSSIDSDNREPSGPHRRGAAREECLRERWRAWYGGEPLLSTRNLKNLSAPAVISGMAREMVDDHRGAMRVRHETQHHRHASVALGDRPALGPGRLARHGRRVLRKVEEGRVGDGDRLAAGAIDAGAARNLKDLSAPSISGA